MANLRINPSGIDDKYLACLNTCFSGWGDIGKFNWYFRRATSAPAADLLVFEEDDRLIAGSGVTYRYVEFPNGKIELAGIMTGSWTLPEYRGQSYFTRAIHESRRIAANRGATTLLAFVTADNASCRALQKAGSLLFPTWYLFSTAATEFGASPDQVNRIDDSQESWHQIFDWRKRITTGFCRFHYQTVRDFKQQFFERPERVRLLSDRQGGAGLVELSHQTEALQLLLVESSASSHLHESLAAFAGRAARNGRKFLFFTSDESMVKSGETLGLQAKPGYLTVLTADGNIPAAGPHNLVANGLNSAKFGRGWAIAGGDRA